LAIGYQSLFNDNDSVDKANTHKIYDVIIVGSGVSGSFMAKELVDAGLDVLLLEAGEFFSRTNFPKKEIDANSKLYWSGGIEFNKSADLAFLRPKVVGGGSIVNQALLDRFDDMALDSFKEQSGVSFFTKESMQPWYEKAESEIHQEVIPKEHRNKNAEIFAKGFEENNYLYDSLTRAQKNCAYEEGNDCIECLSGCRRDSKQSTLITTLKSAINNGLHMKSLFEVKNIVHKTDEVRVDGIHLKREYESFRAKKLVLASGAMGNSKLLLNSGFKKSLPALGQNFYSHPQFMVLGLFKEQINSGNGPFQALKSADPNFRRKGFKLENVFAPPVGISMLLPGHGEEHQQLMKKISHMACIEVAIRDTNPGSIKTNRHGKMIIDKKLNEEDKKRKNAGIEAINNIFSSQGAQRIIEGNLPIGLHLMGGLGIGERARFSVVTPDFHLHGYKNIFAADSSIFPNAPGINPSLTIMALTKMAASKVFR
tara:strand:+ start:153200 stop:154645 length:1446 start_codon:yes stop_codon:yes gene_type:complete